MLTEYLAPNREILSVRTINIDTTGGSPNDAMTYKEELSVSPLLYYYDLQIPLEAIQSLTLDSTGFLPSLSVSFTEKTSIMADKALPGDDAVITVRIPPVSEKILAPVQMDFKILEYTFEDDGAERTYHMECICNVNRMFTDPHRGYAKKSSWEVLKAIAAEAGLGFRSNVSGTQDVMNWINPGLTPLAFIGDNLLPHAWNGESSYMWAYVDMYYNLTYVDVEKALQEDISKQKGVVTSPVLALNPDTPGEAQTIYLTTDPAGKMSSSYLRKPTIRNTSTSTSLSNGYHRDVHFYDRTGNWSRRGGSFMQFTVDSITTPGAEDKSVILKGAPGDARFFQENKGKSYAGRIDTSNVYPDYAYATVQNAQNLVDLQKVTFTGTLPNVNMNLYRFMKLPVVYSYMHKPTIGSGEINERLTGQWLITGVIYTFSSSAHFEQHVQMVKRELNVKDISM